MLTDNQLLTHALIKTSALKTLWNKKGLSFLSNDPKTIPLLLQHYFPLHKKS